MSDLALFIIGTAVFTVTLMAVLWTGYLVFASRFEDDRIATANVEADGDVDLRGAERLPSSQLPSATSTRSGSVA